MKARKVAIGVACFMVVWVGFGFFLQATGYKPPPDPTPKPPAHVISGTFTLVDDETVANNCVGPSDGNPKNVHPGAEIVVKDDGDQVGSGSLGEGQPTVWGQYGSKACAYDFTVGVPTAASSRIVYPGGLSIDYTFEEMQSRDWSIGSACCPIVPGN